MRRTSIGHEFVEFIPPALAEGVIYVSTTYSTAIHLCACGCGNKVVTPISPAEWQLSFDGDSISLTPSIGNWEFPCRSHYWIRRNKIRWEAAWTGHKIEAGRLRDAEDMGEYFAGRATSRAIGPQLATKPGSDLGLIKRIWNRFRR
jgi:hypothetical protein